MRRGERIVNENEIDDGVSIESKRKWKNENDNDIDANESEGKQRESEIGYGVGIESERKCDNENDVDLKELQQLIKNKLIENILIKLDEGFTDSDEEEIFMLCFINFE
ncbi:hypothetical protein C1646_751584 [Rhizophagus diaphanus]|nr:hypothetical protein C1646_751584 [Rhizophagus diaphanus] [Rhizophagus sp. MUCL 43196]